MIDVYSVADVIISIALGWIFWSVLIYIFLKNRIKMKQIVIFSFTMSILRVFNNWLDDYVNSIITINITNSFIMILSSLLSSSILMAAMDYSYYDKMDKKRIIKRTLILTAVLVTIYFLKIIYLNKH